MKQTKMNEKTGSFPITRLRRVKESKLEKKFYDFLEELAVGENNIFTATTFRDKNKIMSIRIKRIYNPQDKTERSILRRDANAENMSDKSVDNPQDARKEQPNFHGTLESQKNMEQLHDRKKTAIIPDNQHPADAYVRLNDVLGMFKNRRQTKTKLIQRQHIIFHLNKLKRYGNDNI
jgi:hypothetical protein